MVLAIFGWNKIWKIFTRITIKLQIIFLKYFKITNQKIFYYKTIPNYKLRFIGKQFFVLITILLELSCNFDFSQIHMKIYWISSILLSDVRKNNDKLICWNFKSPEQFKFVIKNLKLGVAHIKKLNSFPLETGFLWCSLNIFLLLSYQQ